MSPLSSGRRGVAVWLAVAAAIGAVALLLPGGEEVYDLDSADVTGYRALRLLLEGEGVTVRRVDAADVDASTVSDAPVAYVPVATRAAPEQVARWRGFVEAGGTLVLGTPVDGLGVDAPDASTFGGVMIDSSVGGDAAVGLGACDIAEFADLDALAVSPWGVALEVGERSDSCFGDGDSAAVTRVALGSGSVVNLSTPDLFTNDVMGAPRKEDEGRPRPLPDNGVVAVRLLGTGGAVAVVTSGVDTSARLGPGTRTWTDYLAPGVTLALAQLGVALALYTWVRGRRHGRVVSEPHAVTIEASGLVAAVGGLLERHGDAARAAATLRADARSRWAHDLGLGRDVGIEQLAAVVAARTQRPVEEIVGLLATDPVGGDAALAALVHRLDTVHQEALHV